MRATLIAAFLALSGCATPPECEYPSLCHFLMFPSAALGFPSARLLVPASEPARCVYDRIGGRIYQRCD